MILYNVENRENSILLKFLDNAKKKRQNINNIRRDCIRYQERNNNIYNIIYNIRKDRI